MPFDVTYEVVTVIFLGGCDRLDARAIYRTDCKQQMTRQHGSQSAMASADKVSDGPLTLTDLDRAAKQPIRKMVNGLGESC